jgi:hypothetical protein
MKKSPSFQTGFKLFCIKHRRRKFRIFKYKHAGKNEKFQKNYTLFSRAEIIWKKLSNRKLKPGKFPAR